MYNLNRKERLALDKAMKRVGLKLRLWEGTTSTESFDQLIEDLRLILFELHCLLLHQEKK